MTDRRSILTAAGLGLLAAGTGVSVAGCSSPAPAVSGSAPAGSAGRTASGNQVASTDVPVGSGVVVGAFVVAQPTAGSFVAFSNVCPHQSCPVTQVQGAQIVCPCHQSTFLLADGSRVSGPATRGLTPAKATVSGDTVTVSAS